MNHQASTELRALIFRDDVSGFWIAQGLDVDLCAQAKTLEDAHMAFVQLLNATAAASAELGQRPFHDIELAPQRFWRAFEHAPLRTSLESAPRALASFPMHFRVAEQPRFS